MYKSYEEVMNVRLVSYTKVSDDIELSGDDYSHEMMELADLITFCARVSNPSNQGNMKTSDKLIQYMLKHKHFSPFEMANICLEITTTRDIGRQILRHRSFSFQEFSQRYADPTKELEFCLRELRMQDTKNRQNSIECTGPDWFIQDWYDSQVQLINLTMYKYNKAINDGVAKECARVLLPEGNTMSRMYMNGSVRSWIHYLEVRTAPDTQKEHRLVALACAREISKVFQPILNFVNKQEITENA